MCERELDWTLTVEMGHETEKTTDHMRGPVSLYVMWYRSKWYFW
jgi:hypothetical protein